MTKSAFQASYHGWRLAMGRGMVQIIIEVPIENSDDAYQVLGGMPNPGKPVWIGCARIGEPPAATDRDAIDPDPGEGLTVGEDDDKPEIPTHDKRIVRMAALRCKDARFQSWLHSIGRVPEATEDAATVYVRRIAGGQRRDLGKDGFETETEAWKKVDAKFNEHLENIRYAR